MDGPSIGGRVRPRPRILLVEDNEPLRKLVEMTLEAREVEVWSCADVPQARAVMAQRSVDLLITDLMLPGESGLVLVAEIRRQPPDAGPRLPVLALTAGATAADRKALEALGVLRIMTKPVPTDQLLSAVDEALGLPGPGEGLSSPGEDRPSPRGDQAPGLQDPQPTPAAFAGDRALYLAFLAGCRMQFPQDLRHGDAACAGADLAALRHLAHSLKSVWLSLGHADAAADARELEDHCATGRAAEAAASWSRLRSVLERLGAD